MSQTEIALWEKFNYLRDQSMKNSCLEGWDGSDWETLRELIITMKSECLERRMSGMKCPAPNLVEDLYGTEE